MVVSSIRGTSCMDGGCCSDVPVDVGVAFRGWFRLACSLGPTRMRVGDGLRCSQVGSCAGTSVFMVPCPSLQMLDSEVHVGVVRDFVELSGVVSGGMEVGASASVGIVAVGKFDIAAIIALAVRERSRQLNYKYNYLNIIKLTAYSPAKNVFMEAPRACYE